MHRMYTRFSRRTKALQDRRNGLSRATCPPRYHCLISVAGVGTSSAFPRRDEVAYHELPRPVEISASQAEQISGVVGCDSRRTGHRFGPYTPVGPHGEGAIDEGFRRHVPEEYEDG